MIELKSIERILRPGFDCIVAYANSVPKIVNDETEKDSEYINLQKQHDELWEAYKDTNSLKSPAQQAALGQKCN